jgi:hypothetical protein
MDLKEILSVTGKPGLYKTISKTKTNLIAESLVDKKRIPVYASDKMSTLADINIFTTGEDIPLKDVLKLIYDKENGGKSIDHKSDDKKLKEYFEQVLPTYDKGRVYASDIRKIFNWYNILQGFNLLDFTEKPEEVIVEENKEAEIDATKKTIKKATGGTEKKPAKDKTNAAKK